MKAFIFLLVFMTAGAVVASAQSSGTSESGGFDAGLAEKLGADQYGMRSYVMVILKTGPEDSKIVEKSTREKLFAGHFANMKRLADEGKLAVAGPLSDRKPNRGLFILAVPSFEEAEKLVNTDPTVKAGIFVYEMSKLYASAGLMKVGEIHKSIQKEQF